MKLCKSFFFIYITLYELILSMYFPYFSFIMKQGKRLIVKI